MKNNDAQKFRDFQKSQSSSFEIEERDPATNMARLKSLRLAKEAHDKANGIKPAVVAGARMAKSRT
jgi:hypothetical protein